ncbi:peptidase [Massilia sp. WF1]|uniref:RIP metalloprotease RseP n=1 Tax=unclassified Massilia TaxID=2609279 RepID=UPI000689FB11|nr:MULTISPECIES: RIP metalloprotease RseP [unclassified Massilia]ALK97667.1 RIP metalloprotease RseP [Massilia sp. WG5]KNZ67753.1 peptidase [Massilia sp. WF1]
MLAHILIGFLLGLGPLIIIHELGHYFVARLCGVKVRRFSIGMGRVVWSRRIGRDQTEWAVSMLPLGGYVKLVDSRDPATSPVDASEEAREFTRQNVWKRIAIIAAGPAVNFLLAILLMAGLFMAGKEEPGTRLRAMQPDTPVYLAGVRGGDSVSAVNGQPVTAWGDLRWEIVRAALDKRDAELTLHGQGGGSYRAVIPAAAMARLNPDGDVDVMKQLGMQMWRPRPAVDKVIPGGAAARAGLQPGDLAVAIDGKPVTDGIDFIEAVRGAAGRTLQLDVLRAGQLLRLPITPERDPASGAGIVKLMVAQAPEMVTVKAGPLEAVAKGAGRAWDGSVTTLKMIGKMLTGEVSLKNVSGPITIAGVAGQAAGAGFATYIEMLAFISLSLGVMNLLPIPVLDGGQLLYYSLEVLTGRPLSARIGEIAQIAGFGLMLMLMALAVFNDLVRLF